MRRFPLTVVPVVATLALAGCGGSSSGRATGASGSAAFGRCPSVPATPSTASPASVKVQVERHAGAVLTLAPVCIGGKGPYPFIVDTGAATSVIDVRLARRLHLGLTQKQGKVSGVACRSSAYTGQVSAWSVGSTKLPAHAFTSLQLSGNGGAPYGLLGSDVLSTFGAVRLDYAGGRLQLPAADVSGGLAVKTVHASGEVLIAGPARVHGQGPVVFLVDTGASRSTLDAAIAQRLRLPVVRKEKVSGVACTAQASLVRLDGWSFAGRSLPATVADATQLPSYRGGGEGIAGLVGSDVLSSYGAVTVDYAHQRLGLG